MADSEIRIGKVSSVDYETGMARITYRDKDGTVTKDFPGLNFNDEYHMPMPGQQVLVAHLSNGSSRGVILGPIWNKINKPRESGAEIYRKELSRKKDAAYVRYSDENGEYLVKAANVHVNGVNKTVLDGPNVEIAANIGIFLQTEDMKADISNLEVTGGEEDKLSAKIKTDVELGQEENEIKAIILKALVELVEDLKVQAGIGIEVQAAESVMVKAGTKLDISGETSRLSGKPLWI